MLERCCAGGVSRRGRLESASGEEAAAERSSSRDLVSQLDHFIHLPTCCGAGHTLQAQEGRAPGVKADVRFYMTDIED